MAGVGSSEGGWVSPTAPFRPQLHAQAYVKLHSLLQTAVPMRREEACYVLSKLEAVLARALNTSPSEPATEDKKSPAAAAAAAERCSWLVPLVRTLLDRAYGPLGLQWGLPSLPPTNGSPTFFEDFQAFCVTPEWRHFIDKQVPRSEGMGREVGARGPRRTLVSPCPMLQVQPTMSQFEMDTYAKSHDLMSGFWNACYDMLMSSGQRRQRERAHSRRAFQVCGLAWGTWICSTHVSRGQLTEQDRKQPVGLTHSSAPHSPPRRSWCWNLRSGGCAWKGCAMRQH